MRNFIKKYWCIFIGGIFIIPVVLNFLLLIPAITPIVGTNVDWLRFWSSYLGLIIAIIIPSTVCYMSLRENRIARKEQIKKELLQEYKNACIRCGITYLPQHMSETLYYCNNFDEVQKALKDHNQQILQDHLNFLLHCDMASETMKSLEKSCFEWHNYLLKDAFSIVKGILIEDKDLFKAYMSQHKFNKKIPDVEKIIDKSFDKGKYIFVLTILGELIKQYTSSNKVFTEFNIQINQLISFDAFISELQNSD